jgi:hypothetical protein
MRLTPEILIKYNDVDYVLQVMADYTGSDASMGPMYEVGDYDKRSKVNDQNKRIL